MIGLRIGTRIGPRGGPAIGVGRDAIAASAAFPTDAASMIGVPVTQADWNSVFDAAIVTRKTLHSSWSFQDAAGNAVATVGTDLTAAGTIAYNTAVSGWTRTAQRFSADVLAGQRHAAAVGANPATTSTLWFGYIDVTATPAAIRIMLGTLTAPETNLRITTVPALRLSVNGVNTAGSNPVTGGVRPFVVLQDRTGSRSNGYSDQDKLLGTFVENVDSTKGFGPGATNVGQDVLLGALFAGVHAEWTDAEVKAVLQTLGWTIPW